MTSTAATRVITFSPSTYTVSWGNREVPWYESQYGHYFLKASDLVRLLNLNRDEARCVYEDTIPEHLQTTYLCREVAGFFLHSLKTLSAGESFGLWKAIESEFYADSIDSKFDLPIIPYRRGSRVLPGIDTSMLVNLGQLKVLQSRSTSQLVFAKREHIYSPLYGLVTTDGQMQHLFDSVLTKDLTAKSYVRAISRASKVEDTTPVAPEEKPNRGAKLNATLTRENAQLRETLANPSRAIAKEKEKALLTVHDTANSAAAKLMELLNEHYLSLFTQQLLLQEVSGEIRTVYGDWDHRKFLTLFDNTRIMGLIREINTQLQAQVADGEVDFATITGVVEANVGRHKKLVRQMMDLVRAKHVAKTAKVAK